MRAKLWAVAALAAGMVLGARGESFTRAGVTYARRGGLGTGDYVATNVAQTAADVGAVPNDGVWEQVKTRALNTDGNVRLLPPYLHYIKLDNTYPDDAQWLYGQRRPLAFGACSARRIDGQLERTYDWVFDHTPEFVLDVSGGEGRFASVGVASGYPYLTENFVNSGKWSRYYKCLAGATLDGINENGVVAEINVCSGTNGWRGTSLHYLGAVRWALDHGTNAQQAAEYIAANVYVPAGLDMNFHYMVADKTSTYIVENGVAHRVLNMRGVPVVMTNFRLYPVDTEGEGQERAQVLANPANGITNAWWTQAYLPNTSPVRVSDIGANTQAVYAAWAEKTREEHRGETRPSGAQWWQSVHTSVYDFDTLTLRVAVQETDDWYEFSVPSGGKVKSVNGRTGAVVLDAAAIPYSGSESYEQVADVEKGLDYAIQTADYAMAEATGRPTYDDLNGYLPLSGGVVNGVGVGDTFEGCLSADRIFCGGVPHITLNINGGMLDAYAGRWFYSDNGDYSDEYEIAVKGDIPKLPTKWALANVTNASGKAISAEDVGAVPNNEGVADANAFRSYVALVNGIYNKDAGAPWIDVENGALNPDLPDSKWYYHGRDDEHEIAVKGDIPKLPAKWALSNVTNENGEAVSAEDVGALPLTYDGDIVVAEQPCWNFVNGNMRIGHLGQGLWGLYTDAVCGLLGVYSSTQNIFEEFPRIGFGYLSDDDVVFNVGNDSKAYYAKNLEVSADREIAVKGDISADNPSFAAAVLAVGLNIDTNSVAVLNEIAATFGGFPIAGTATTVGGLLAALAAAVAWLRKRAAHLDGNGYGDAAFVTDLVSKQTVKDAIDARLPYPIYAVPTATGLLKDRALNTTSLASVTVPDNFTDLLIRASVATSLPVTMPSEITTIYGDTFPNAVGEYLITITKTGAAEAYVRTIKLEVANA